MTHYIGRLQDLRIVIIPRHGEEDEFALPATLVKEQGYEANIWRLYELGAEAIFGFSAVGSLDLYSR